MPQRRTGFKALRQNQKRHMHNLDIKSDIKRSIKNFLVSIESKNKQEAQTGLNIIFKKLDKAAKRNLLKKNTISRRKSRFSKLLSRIS